MDSNNVKSEREHWKKAAQNISYQLIYCKGLQHIPHSSYRS